MPPVHPLEEVCRLAREEGANARIDEDRALDVVVALLDLEERAARAFILARVAALQPENFAHTLANFAPPADVYGIEFAGRPWYCKVAIEVRRGRRLLVVSFHPPTDPLRTPAGTVRR